MNYCPTLGGLRQSSVRKAIFQLFLLMLCASCLDVRARAQVVFSNDSVLATPVGNGTQGYAGDNGLATSAELYWPESLVVDSSGNIYILDQGNSVIRKVAASTGVISTIAGNGTAGYSGDGGQAINAELNFPSGLAFDASGNLYIADTSNNVIRMISRFDRESSLRSWEMAPRATGNYDWRTGDEFRTQLTQRCQG